MSLHATQHNKDLTAAEDPELHGILVKYFEDFEEQTRPNRTLAERDRDYTDHIQWTEEEKRILKQRRQQPVVNNIIRKNVNFLRGYERKIRTDPKAQPRTPKSEKDAFAVTDALRFVSDNTKFDTVRSLMWDNFIVEGVCACEITVSKDEKREIKTTHIPYDRTIYDYHSRINDFSDGRYSGIVIWDDVDEIKRRFKGSKDVVDFAIMEHATGTFSDKPTLWVDSARQRMRTIQLYFIYKGLWHLAFFTKAGFLTPPILSPWLDENGQPRNGIVMKSAYMDREGNRYGEVRFQIETQDGINQRESKMVHQVSQRQTWSNDKAFAKGARAAKVELAKADGHVTLTGGARIGDDFGIIQTNDMAQGQFQLLQESKNAALSMSSDSFQGTSAQAKSGAAIIAEQNGQQIEIIPLADLKREFEVAVYTKWWDMIRQFWIDERWIRVTDNEDNIKFVGFNKKVKVRDVLKEDGVELPAELNGDPRLEAIARVDSKPSEIDVDIVITDAKDIVTTDNEEFDKLIALAGVGVTFDQKVYIKASNLRNKDELLKGLEGADEQQQQAIQAQQQAQQQQAIQNADLQNAAVAAEVEKDGADTSLKRSQAAKTEQEAMQIAIENDQLERGIKL